MLTFGRTASFCLSLSLFFFSFLESPATGWGSVGTEGASFLDIPVGARPAALGSAYSPIATDAYAPTWNPAGLGFLSSTQLAGMHLAYLENTSYEYASLVHPLSPGHALGTSIQYFRPDTISGLDINANPIGDISGYFAAYSLAYGQTLGKNFSLGVTGKWITAKIDDVSASAYGVDVGSLYRMKDNLSFAAVVANVGSKLTFIKDGDPLPQAFRFGASYKPHHDWTLLAEGSQPTAGPLSMHTGVEWSAIEEFAARIGYNTEKIKELSAVAGLTIGVGIKLWGQEFAYAWLPVGQLGQTQYFSLVFRFGKIERKSEEEETLVSDEQEVKEILREKTHQGDKDLKENLTRDSEYQLLDDMLEENDIKAMKKKGPGK